MGKNEAKHIMQYPWTVLRGLYCWKPQQNHSGFRCNDGEHSVRQRLYTPYLDKDDRCVHSKKESLLPGRETQDHSVISLHVQYEQQTYLLRYGSKRRMTRSNTLGSLGWKKKAQIHRMRNEQSSYHGHHMPRTPLHGSLLQQRKELL
jgi:hypothetical protein